MAKNELPRGVAIVTGAAGGMGRECARLLAEDGWGEVLLCDLDASSLEAVAGPLREKGAKVEILAGEITAPDFAARLEAALAGRPIAAVIHTAGVSPQIGDKDRVLAINLDATLTLVDFIRPRMAEGGAAVLFASIAGFFPTTPELDALFEQPMPPEGSNAFWDKVPDANAAYFLSKRAVRALAKREAKSFGANKARLLSISPGMVDTAMVRGDDEEQLGQMLSVAALPRLGQPEELAGVAVFMCSPKASYVTGCDIIVDGGTLPGLGL